MIPAFFLMNRKLNKTVITLYVTLTDRIYSSKNYKNGSLKVVEHRPFAAHARRQASAVQGTARAAVADGQGTQGSQRTSITPLGGDDRISKLVAKQCVREFAAAQYHHGVKQRHGDEQNKYGDVRGDRCVGSIEQRGHRGGPTV